MTKVLAVAKSSAAPYFVMLFTTIALARLLQFLWPDESLLKGQNPATLLQLLVIPVLVLIWAAYRPPPMNRRYLAVFVGALGLNFVFHFVLGSFRGELWNYSALLFPLALVLVWLKPPSFRAVIVATDVLCGVVIAISVAAQVAIRFDLAPLHNYVQRRYLRVDSLDLLYWRWEGPFGNVNFAGPVGAFVFAYGLARSGVTRWVFVASGAIMVIASESRGAALAACVGLIVWLLTQDHLRLWHPSRRTRQLAALGFSFAAVAAILLLDRDLNGRVAIWSDFAGQWLNSPWIGISDEQLRGAISAGDVVPSGTTGHSLVFDSLALSGAIGLALTALTLGVVASLAWRALRKGQSAPAVLLATFLTANLTESLTNWLYLNLQSLPLLISGLLGATWLHRAGQGQGPLLRGSVEAISTTYAPN